MGKMPGSRRPITRSRRSALLYRKLRIGFDSLKGCIDAFVHWVVQGSGNISIDGDFLWSGGSFLGTGGLTVLSGRSLTLVGQTEKSMPRSLNGPGTVFVDEGDLIFAGGTFAPQVSITKNASVSLSANNTDPAPIPSAAARGTTGWSRLHRRLRRLHQRRFRHRPDPDRRQTSRSL